MSDAISAIPIGTAPLLPSLVLVDYVSADGRFNGSAYADIVSDFDEANAVPEHPMEWTCQDDTEFEEPEVSLTVSQFAELRHKAQLWDRHICE